MFGLGKSGNSGDLIENIDLEHLKNLLSSAGHQVINCDEESAFLVVETPQRAGYFIRCTAPDEAGAFRGILLQITGSGGPEIDGKLIDLINLNNPAVVTARNENDELVFSRYLALDGGIAGQNIIENIGVFFSCVSAAYAIIEDPEAASFW